MSKIYAFDLDGTLCTDTFGVYENAIPFPERIKIVNRLYKKNRIVIWTARGGTTGIDWTKITKAQLKKWKVKYHKLIIGKLYYDLYIDNRSMHSDVFFKK